LRAHQLARQPSRHKDDSAVRQLAECLAAERGVGQLDVDFNWRCKRQLARRVASPAAVSAALASRSS
jgi:hypothetical protein